ncbi:MAG TPA: hypothetical protein VIT88_15025 [Pyrinomonadaceae bacterium]
MSVSRRNFLTSSAALSVAFMLKPGTSVLGQNSVPSNNARLRSTSSQFYSRATFEPLVGDTFRVRVDTQTIDLKLVSIADIKSNAAGITTGRTSRMDCFSLRFHASKPLPATATLHNLEHQSLGSFGLFMTQSDAGSGFLQTAIVNHRA